MKSIIIIGFTGCSRPGVEECLRSGMSEVLLKPVRMSML